MFAFYTDGGVHQDSWYYGIHRIFGNGEYLHSTRQITEPSQNPVHIQAYGGRQAVYNNTKALSTYKPDPSNHMVLDIPIDSFLLDKEENETFKQLTGIKIDQRITHYTCLCNYFMIFVSD
jgi:hypothetical protein